MQNQTITFGGEPDVPGSPDVPDMPGVEIPQIDEPKIPGQDPAKA